jgi:hypothetical protein
MFCPVLAPDASKRATASKVESVVLMGPPKKKG